MNMRWLVIRGARVSTRRNHRPVQAVAVRPADVGELGHPARSPLREPGSFAVSGLKPDDEFFRGPVDRRGIVEQYTLTRCISRRD